MTNVPPHRWGLLLVPLAFAGCTVLAPQSDASRYFTLTASAPPAAVENRSELTYGLGPVDLPAYLDRNEVATRVSGSELVYSPTDRWAAPLQTNVTQVLLQNLTNILGTDRIVLYPWSETAVDYRIEVRFLHLEPTGDASTQLVARWSIRDGRTGVSLKTRDSTVTRSTSTRNTADTVKALSESLGELSEEIASNVRQLPPPPGTTARRKKS